MYMPLGSPASALSRATSQRTITPVMLYTFTYSALLSVVTDSRPVDVVLR